MDAKWEEFIKIPRYDVEDQKIWLSGELNPVASYEVYELLESTAWLRVDGDYNEIFYGTNDENFDPKQWTPTLAFECGCGLDFRCDNEYKFTFFVSGDGLDDTEVHKGGEFIHVFDESGQRYILTRDKRPLVAREYKYMDQFEN